MTCITENVIVFDSKDTRDFPAYRSFGFTRLTSIEASLFLLMPGRDRLVQVVTSRKDPFDDDEP